MKKLFKKLSKLSIILAVIAAVVLIGTAVFAASYVLNKTVPATVTITQSVPPEPTPTEVTLYSDALCNTPIPSDYVHNFGTLEEGGTPQAPLWFKSTEITPSTINVTDDWATGDVSFLVGTPIDSMPGKPCTLALWLPSTLSPGTYTFNFTVTGSGSN